MMYFFLGLLTSSSLFELCIILYFVFLKKEKSNEVVYDYEKIKNEDPDVAIDKSEFFR